jgi:hypothetical protein
MNNILCAFLRAFLSFCCVTVALGQQTWESMNGPPSGEISAITVTDSGTLLIAAGVAGIWRSTDDGMTWDSVNAGLEARDVRRVSFERDGKLYATTFGGMIHNTDLGGYLYRSTDEGSHWTRVCIIGDTYYSHENAFHRFAVNSKGHLYTAISKSMTDLIQISTNGGTSWVTGAVPQSISSAASIYALTIDSSDSIVATGWPFFAAKSADSCMSWKPIHVPAEAEVAGATVLALSPGGDLFINAGHSGYYRPTGVCRVNKGSDVPVLLDSTWQASSFSFMPSGVVWAAGTDGAIRKSTNNGDAWVVVADSSASASLVCHTPHGSLIASSYAKYPEVIRSTNGGISWNGVTSPPHISCVTTILQTRDSIVWAGNSRGVWFPRKSSGGWTRGHTNLYLTPRTTHFVRASRTDSLYAAIEGNTPSVSGGGNHVKIVNPHWLVYYTWKVVPVPLTLEAGHRSLVFVGTARGVYYFDILDSSGSRSMKEIGLGDRRITDLVRNAKDSLFAAASGVGVYRTGNAGASWTLVSSGMTDIDIYSLAVDSAGRLYAGTASGLFVSTDEAASWTRCAGFPDLAARVVAAAPSGRVYVGTSAGVYTAAPGDTVWQSLAAGLQVPDVRSLVIGVDGYVYAGTNGAGAFRIALAMDPTGVTTNKPVPTEFALEQNYPNPFNPSTVVSCQLPVASHMRIAVYDILGREVAVLMDEKKEGGRYEVTWDARGCASGVYFYRLSAGSFMATRKMLLVR